MFHKFIFRKIPRKFNFKKRQNIDLRLFDVFLLPNDSSFHNLFSFLELESALLSTSKDSHCIITPEAFYERSWSGPILFSMDCSRLL